MQVLAESSRALFLCVLSNIVLHVTAQCNNPLRIPLGAGLSEVISPGWLDGYGQNLNCTWEFVTEDVESSILFKITNDVHCGDRLAVYNGRDIIEDNICRDGRPVEAYTSPGNSLIVRFQTDDKSYPEEQGFIVQALTAKDEHCGSTTPLNVTEEEQSFTSKHFPLDYPANITCEFTLIPSDASKRIQIKFPYAKNELVEIIEEGMVQEICIDDIEIFQGSSKIGHACGTGFPEFPITFTGFNGATLRVIFTSDVKNQYRGFKATHVLVPGIIKKETRQTTIEMMQWDATVPTPTTSTPVSVQPQMSRTDPEITKPTTAVSNNDMAQVNVAGAGSQGQVPSTDIPNDIEQINSDLTGQTTTTAVNSWNNMGQVDFNAQDQNHTASIESIANSTGTATGETNLGGIVKSVITSDQQNAAHSLTQNIETLKSHEEQNATDSILDSQLILQESENATQLDSLTLMGSPVTKTNLTIAESASETVGSLRASIESSDQETNVHVNEQAHLETSVNQQIDQQALANLIATLVTTTTSTVTTEQVDVDVQYFTHLSLIERSPFCRPGWIYYNNRCYLMSRQRANWFESQFLCRMLGGTLAAVQDKEEDILLEELSKNYAYVGCFKDWLNPRVLPEFYYNQNLTNRWCIERCRAENYVFAGTQFHTQCFCGNTTWNKFDAAPEEDCYTQCAGNMNETCGGHWRLSVHDIGGRAHWLGGTDFENEGIWRWQPSTEILTYTNWLPGEPNNQIHPDMKLEHCLSLYPDNRDGRFRWNDESCHKLLHFICERGAENLPL